MVAACSEAAATVTDCDFASCAVSLRLSALALRPLAATCRVSVGSRISWMNPSSRRRMRSACCDFAASSFSRAAARSRAVAAISASRCAASKRAACACAIRRSRRMSATSTMTITVMIESDRSVSLLAENPSMSSRAVRPTAEARPLRFSRFWRISSTRDLSSAGGTAPASATIFARSSTANSCERGESERSMTTSRLPSALSRSSFLEPSSDPLSLRRSS